MKTLRRHRTVDEVNGAEVEVEQAATWSTTRHLDETITLQGFYCLHDCRWPGTKNGRIDHVVIGATGVWVIADERPADDVSLVENALRAGRTSLSPELRRLRDQSVVLGGILDDVEVQPILSIHGVSLPRHSFQVDDVRVAGSLWPTSQVIARPSAFLEAIDVERLALIAIEALRPAGIVGPRLAPPGAPVISLPFVPGGSVTDADREPWVASEADARDADAAHRRRVRLARRVALAAVLALMALGVVIELTGDDSTLRGEPAAEESSSEPDEVPNRF